MEVVGIFYGFLVYFTAIWYIVSPFGIFGGNFVYFVSCGMLYYEKATLCGYRSMHSIVEIFCFIFHHFFQRKSYVCINFAKKLFCYILCRRFLHKLIWTLHIFHFVFVPNHTFIIYECTYVTFLLSEAQPYIECCRFLTFFYFTYLREGM
jgi:hypothetical protein